MNILVVDDNKSVRDTLLSLLTDQGHDVDVAINGLDALGKAQNNHYQLFVIDHLMPLMNGLQLSKNLKNRAEMNDIKIIFMTTQGIHTLRTLPEFSLFDDVIDKPITQNRLIDAITALSGLTALTDELFEYDSLEVNA